jgi:hypothetical protein
LNNTCENYTGSYPYNPCQDLDSLWKGGPA